MRTAIADCRLQIGDRRFEASRPNRRSAICNLQSAIAAVLLVCSGSVAHAQDGGATIDSVIIHQRNVFDPGEAAGNVLFSLSNAFHIRTQRYVIGQELLFDRGDPYDSLVLAETERNLRALGLFRDVDIDTVRSDGRLHAVVDVADAWTTTLQADGRSTGDQLTWGIGVKEKNILGTGTLFRAKFRHEVDRNSFTLEASQHRLLGTRAGFFWRWDNLSDGTKGVFGGGAPFRAFADRRAVELDGEWASQRVLRFRDGALDEEFFRRLFRVNLRAAAAPVASERGYARLRLDAQLKREEYLALTDTGLAVPDTVTFAVGLTASLARARFLVTHYYLAFARDVDVDLSIRVTAGVWLAPSAFGYGRTGIGPTLDVQVGAALGRQFVRVEGHANGLFTGAGLDSGQVRAIVTAVSQILPQQATVLRIEAGARSGTPPAEEFDVGFDRGLRRFPAHAFTGDRELWGTIEQRVFLVDAFLRLFGLGVAGFVDYGSAWYRGEEPRTGGSVGLGLRLSSIRAGDVTMGRLDVAYRFGDGFGDKRWVFSFGRNVTF
jgi:hypothetical protein